MPYHRKAKRTPLLRVSPVGVQFSDGSVVSFQKTAVAVLASVVVFLKTVVAVLMRLY